MLHFACIGFTRLVNTLLVKTWTFFGFILDPDHIAKRNFLDMI